MTLPLLVYVCGLLVSRACYSVTWVQNVWAAQMRDKARISYAALIGESKMFLPTDFFLLLLLCLTFFIQYLVSSKEDHGIFVGIYKGCFSYKRLVYVSGERGRILSQNPSSDVIFQISDSSFSLPGVNYHLSSLVGFLLWLSIALAQMLTMINANQS